MSKENLISNELMCLDITVEKISIVLDDLKEGYFENDALRPEDKVKSIYYNQAETRLHIIEDYITALEETIANMQRNMNE